MTTLAEVEASVNAKAQEIFAKENIMNPTKRQQKCAQFDSKGNHCGNLADLLAPNMPLDFCAKHNHMAKTGMPVKCWRCGDR